MVEFAILGGGAIARGPGAVAAGAGGVAIGGDYHGDIVIGGRSRMRKSTASKKEMGVIAVSVPTDTKINLENFRGTVVMEDE